MFNFFRNLFRHQDSEHIPASTAVETAPIPEEQLSQVSQPEQEMEIKPPQLQVGIAQSVGMQRNHNEDTIFAMSAILADGEQDVPFGIFIVADGMGGHLNGEIASGTAAKTLGSYLLAHYYFPYLSGDIDRQETGHEALENGVSEAQNAVLARAPGGGTTLTAALVVGDQVTISHVGDSRAYFIHADGQIKVMTQDHSLVKRLQDLGQIDEKEASVHPQRNVLYRALGQSEPFKPDINTYSLPPHGYLLLCSDGLWGSVPEAEIYQIVHTHSDLTQACQSLVNAANSAGGPDNISAVLVRYLG